MATCSSREAIDAAGAPGVYQVVRAGLWRRSWQWVWVLALLALCFLPACVCREVIGGTMRYARKAHGAMGMTVMDRGEADDVLK